jgi:hypothetical protein
MNDRNYGKYRAEKIWDLGSVEFLETIVSTHSDFSNLVFVIAVMKYKSFYA